MPTLIVDLPEFIGNSSTCLMIGVFMQIEERINIMAAYQRHCLKMFRSTGLSEMAQFKYQLMYDWACSGMNDAHYTAQRICELRGHKLRIRHDHTTRRWVLEVTR
jgi:hypothetical protein